MIVYILTSGTYSDYCINAVFDDKNQAKFYQKLHPACEIEEFDTEAVKIDARKIRYEWTARISPDGKLLLLYESATLTDKEDSICLTDVFPFGVHFLVTLTTDRELEKSVVAKACFDRVAKFKAAFLGL